MARIDHAIQRLGIERKKATGLSAECFGYSCSGGGRYCSAGK